MLFPSDLMVLGTRYYHESGVPSYCALQHQGHNCFRNSSSTRGLSSTQQQARSSGFESSSATGRWEGRNMQRVVSRHTAVKLNQVLKLGFNPACSVESHHGWRGLGFSHNFALQAKDFSVRSLVGNSPSRVLGSLPGGQTGGNNGSSSVRISCSSVPHIRPPISRRSFRESRKLLTRTSRQQRSTSSRIGSTGDFSPEWLLEAAVDVLRNFNEKVNSLFQGGRGGGGGDGGSRDFATAAEEKVLTSAENGVREENVVPELVEVVSNQEQQGGEFEWRSALWEAEVSSVEELEAVAQKIEETTPTTVSISPELQRPDLQSPELQSPELQNHDNGNIISEVPIRAAQSSLPTEEREILQQESTADSPTGVVSGLGTDDEHTSSQLSAFHVPEPISLSEAADVEIRIDDKIEEAALAEGAVFENRELEHAENGIVVGTVQQEVSSAEIEQTEVRPVVLPTDVTGLGADGDISQFGGSVDPQSALSEAAVEIREEEMIEEEIIESTTAHRELEHIETGTMGSTIQVTESASLVELEVAEEEALSEADAKIRAEVKIEESVTEAITGNPELDHPQNMEVGSTIQGSEGASVEVKEVDIGELWYRNTSGYPPFTSFEPSLSRELQPRDSEQVLLEDAQQIAAVDSTEGGETLSLEGQVVAEENLSLVGQSDGIDSAVEEVEQHGTLVDTLPAHDSLGPASVEIGEAVESSEGQVVAEESVSLVGKSDEIENAVEEVEQRGTPVDTVRAHDSLRTASGESGAAVESSSFEGQTTLAGEAGSMEEVKQISEEFGEPFREQQDTADVVVATDSLSTDRNIAGTDDLDLHSEISRLRNSISQYAYRYHTLDSPVISDAAYDSLVKELVNLEAQVATSETSPSVGVAAPPSPDFLKVLHSVPMLSLASVQKEEEVLLWYRKLQQKLGLDLNTSGWVAEPKVDGLALSLRYEDGILKRAATRGNGIQGEDVTHNAQRVLGIPLTIPQNLPGTECPLTELEVRGEIFMSLKDFEELNASKIQAGEKPFSNPRNAAAGSMRLLSSNSNELRPLSFMAYSVGVIKESTEEDSEKSSLIPTSQWEVLQLLNSAGFPVNEDNRLCESFDSALEYAESWRSMRKNLEYEADGVVLKVNDLETQASLGSTGTDPRWALAWKFAATEAVSVLEGIELTIGRSGAMIPNARLKPVELGGAVISRASLHNFRHVKALGLCEGDHVVVQRAGDVIPKVVQVLEDLRPETATPWVPPQECPTCGSALTEASASAMIFCSNSTCPSRHSRQVGHFAKTLIPGLGSATLSRLEEDLVKDPADFYDLDEKSLSKVKGFGKQSIKKLLKSIEESKQQDLWLFIAALGIPKVGTNTAKELAKTFGSLQALMESDASGFTDVPGIGPATASSIFDWCQTEVNIELVHRLEEAGCKINGNQVIETHGSDSKEDSLIKGASPGLTGESEGSPDVVEDRTEDIKTSVSVKESDVVEDLDLEEVIKTDESEEIPWDLKKDDEAVEDVTSQPSTPPLSGKSIVITGDFGTMKREDMKKLVTLHGGAVRTSVTSKTSFLLCGNRPGPLKVAEASRRGVEMLDWQSFMSLIGQTESDIV
ncbi:unnamed protein product [Calypogeia fissa]